jgi:hypothetical protein
MAVAHGAAQAIPIVDVVNPAEPIEVDSVSQSYSFTHDITDDFNPLFDIITSATISINLSDPDPGDGNGNRERVSITLDSQEATTFNNVGLTYNYTALIPSINDLNADGMLKILLRTLDTNGAGTFYGNFFFDNSTLTAQVTKGNPVPEPTTLALLSLGLAGLGYARCRKARKV